MDRNAARMLSGNEKTQLSRRDDILSQATDAFLTHGYAGPSMADHAHSRSAQIGTLGI